MIRCALNSDAGSVDCEHGYVDASQSVAIEYVATSACTNGHGKARRLSGGSPCRRCSGDALSAARRRDHMISLSDRGARPPLERGERQNRCVGIALDRYLYVGGHSRSQSTIAVARKRNRIVRRNVIHDRRILANLIDARYEGSPGIGEYRERDALANTNRTDIRLADGDIELHLSEVFRNGEERRRL